MKKIILASKSPRRKELLTQIIGNNFKIIESPFQENNNQKVPPKELAKIHALGKAKEVAKTLNEGIVIGSDTFISFNSKVFGKAHTKENAIKMLSTINGNEIEVFTGIALIDAQSKKEIIDFEITKIKIKTMTKEEINRYVEVENPIGFAGGFAIQHRGAILVENLEGSYSNIVGLPLFKLNQMFEKMGVNIYGYK